MNLEWSIASKYLISRKKSNAINIISVIAIVGIAIGSCSTILVSSVFNGLEEVIMGMFNSFNPDIKILPSEGKRFEEDSILISEIMHIDDVIAVSRVLEETAIFEYSENRDFGKIKGVDSNFDQVVNPERFVQEGVFRTFYKNKPGAFISTPMAGKLAVNFDNLFEPIRVYTRSKRKRSPLDKPFSTWPLVPVGRFDVSSEGDQKMVLTDLNHVRQMLSQPNALSALELGIRPDANLNLVKERISSILGSSYVVQDRNEQESSFLKLMNIEKWVGFAILSLTMLLISFNMLGSMWMIFKEKQSDIGILKALGLSDQSARNIFIYQGLMMSLLGLILGLFLALIFYFLQIRYGLVTLDEGMALNAYPIKLKWSDFIPITVVVLLLGWLSSLPAGLRAQRMTRLIES